MGAGEVLGVLSHRLSPAVEILLLGAVISLIPVLLVMFTGFVRIVIVLSLLRMGLGAPSLPPNSVLFTLALSLTLYSMAPVLSEVRGKALDPYLRGEIGWEEAVQRGLGPIREFMLSQVEPEDLRLFTPRGERRLEPEGIPLSSLIPAFVLGETRKGFMMGFAVTVPLLAVDIAVSVVLLSMGIFMLPPTVISVPLKIMVFTLSDGWTLLSRALLLSFRG